eukprot:Sspe_Gene.97736::Locus_71275_Transcript_1_1_Confidence_1.000_Length_679::g.97736::m.97736
MRKRKENKPAAQPYYCVQCKLVCNSEKQIKEHMNGMKHLEAERQMESAKAAAAAAASAAAPSELLIATPVIPSREARVPTQSLPSATPAFALPVNTFPMVPSHQACTPMMGSLYPSQLQLPTVQPQVGMVFPQYSYVMTAHATPAVLPHAQPTQQSLHIQPQK